MVTLEEMQLLMGFSQHSLLGWAEIQIDSATSGVKRAPHTKPHLEASGGREELLSATRNGSVTDLSSRTFHNSSNDKMPFILANIISTFRWGQ